MNCRRIDQKLFLCILCLFVANAVVAQTGPRSLPAVRSQADFDRISVTYDANTPYALPHVMFVIDRKDGNKIYYINKKRYSFHKDLLTAPISHSNAARSFSRTTISSPTV